MKKAIALSLAFVLALGAVCACAAESEPMTWKIGYSGTDTSPWSKCLQKFADTIAEKTGGAVRVELYAGDQLTAGSQTDGIQAVMDGTTEISMHSNMIWAAFDQRFSVVCLPFLFDNNEEVDAALDGAGGKALSAILENEYGVHLMGIGEDGFRHVTNSKRPIKTMADMKNLKIRVAGSQVVNRAYQLWGVDFVNANWSEVFTALQTGTYDGQENPLPNADSASIPEVQKYATYWTGIYDCTFFSMNEELYKSLSPELQKIVDEAGAETCRYQREITRAEDQAILKKWHDMDIEVEILSPEAAAELRAAAAPVYKEFEEQLTPELIKAFTDAVGAVRGKK